MCTFRALHCERSAYTHTPLWEPSRRPGPAEPACPNRDVYSTQARVSTTRKQRDSALGEGLFCTPHLVFAHFPGEASTAAVGGHPPLGSLWSPGVHQWRQTVMYIYAEI